ncbi:MAG TPA: hypothetical protein VE863_05880, partial [Pyrinomonadaceae bacterium]|nr:hypothetical protein [Pyrinomonadaceae bacterium]
MNSGQGRTAGCRTLRGLVSGATVLALMLPFLLFCAPPDGRTQTQSQSVTYDNSATAAASYTAATSKTLSWSHTIGNGANRILIVGVSISTLGPSLNPVVSVTYGSVSLVRIGNLLSTDHQILMNMFEMLAPPPGTQTVTVTLAPSVQTYVVGGSASFLGVNQRSPFRAQLSGSMATNTGTFKSPDDGTSSSPNVTLVSGSNDLMLDVVTTTTGASLLASSSQSTLWKGHFLSSGINIGGGSNYFDIGAASIKRGASPRASMSWQISMPFNETGTGSPASWAVGAVSLIPSGAPAQPTPTPLAVPSPPAVHNNGLPPGPNLPNLDIVRKLQSAAPVVRPGGHAMTAEQPICDVGSDCGGCPDCGGPPTPNDPGYSTPRTQPQNKTGQPGITLGSRNFNWDTSLVNLKGRASLDLNLALSYNSLVWVYDNGQMKFNPDDGFPGPGFHLGFPIVQPRFQNADTGIWSYLMITPSGARVELRQVGSSSIYESYDSSHMQLTDNGGGSLTVNSSDGSQFAFTDTGASFVCAQIEDRNGNLISISYNGNVPATVTDTVGRIISFNYSNGFLTSITQGGKTWASFNYNSIVFNYNFPGLQVNAPANNSLLAVPTQVNVEDGSSYQFTYNSWGQVYQVTHVAPDGNTTMSYTSYNLPTDASNPQSDCPRFTEQHDFARDWNGGAEAVTQLGVDSDGGQVMITPDGTRYKELYNMSGFANGLPNLEEWWSGGVRQKWVTYSWTQDNPALPYPVNPRLVDMTVSDLNGNQRRKSISYSAFTMPSGSSCSLPTDVIEYAADAATPLRRTHTDYNLGGAYLGRNLIGLSSSTAVYDGGGTLFARSDFNYDETNLQDAGGITQHDGSFGVGLIQGRGNVTSVKRFNANDLSQTTTSSAVYDIAGSRISSRDASGHTTSISYADSNGGSSFAYPTQVT